MWGSPRSLGKAIMQVGMILVPPGKILVILTQPGWELVLFHAWIWALPVVSNGWLLVLTLSKYVSSLISMTPDWCLLALMTLVAQGVFVSLISRIPHW